MHAHKEFKIPLSMKAQKLCMAASLAHVLQTRKRRKHLEGKNLKSSNFTVSALEDASTKCLTWSIISADICTRCEGVWFLIRIQELFFVSLPRVVARVMLYIFRCSCERWRALKQICRQERVLFHGNVLKQSNNKNSCLNFYILFFN